MAKLLLFVFPNNGKKEGGKVLFVNTETTSFEALLKKVKEKFNLTNDGIQLYLPNGAEVDDIDGLGDTDLEVVFVLDKEKFVPLSSGIYDCD